MTPALFFVELQKSWRLPNRQSIYAWAAEHVRLPDCLTKPGRFSVDESRHFLAIFDALQDDHVREVNVVAPIGSGKTLIADIWLQWLLENDPGHCAVIMQTDEIAKRHGDTRIWPMLEASKNIAGMLAGAEQRATEIVLRNGVCLKIQGPGLNKLQSIPYRFVRLDEPWIYKPGTIDEAKGRLSAFLKIQMSKLCCISQGGYGDSDWHRQWQSGERNEWLVSCSACGKYFLPAWSHLRGDGRRAGMVWDEIKDSATDWHAEACAETARYECPFCLHPIVDNAKTKAEWNRLGKYEANYHDRTRKSFHWTAVIDYPWKQLVHEYLTARNAYHRGAHEPTIAFFTKRMADFHGAVGSAIEGALQFTLTDTATDWPEQRVKFLTVDRQAEDVFWWTVRGWAVNGKSRRLGFGKCYSFEDIEAIRTKENILPPQVFIDSGYRPKGDRGVYQACLRYGWTACRGVAAGGGDEVVFKVREGERIVERSYTFALGDPESGNVYQGQRFCTVIRFSSPTMKNRVLEMVTNGNWMEPLPSDDETEKEYCRQMNGEIRTMKNGKWIWTLRHGGRNHALDLAAMQTLGATICNFLPDIFNAPIPQTEMKTET